MVQRRAVTLLLPLGAALAAAGLAGCGASVPDTMKVGVVVAQSGPFALRGQDLARGAQLAADELNLGPFKVGGKTVKIYGTAFSSFYINANGNLTFTGPDGTFTESLPQHFAVRRVSALFDDLDPAQGGSIMMVLGTDAPLSERQLRRVALCGAFGLGRAGSFASNSSGEYVIAFSTAHRVAHRVDMRPVLRDRQRADRAALHLALGLRRVEHPLAALDVDADHVLPAVDQRIGDLAVRRHVDDAGRGIDAERAFLDQLALGRVEDIDLARLGDRDQEVARRCGAGDRRQRHRP